MKLVASGYCFAPVADPGALRLRIAEQATALDLLGTVLVAPEGVNLSVHGAVAALDAFQTFLRAEPGFGSLALARSGDFGLRPFRRMKVQVRVEIVSLGREGDSFDHDGARRLSPDAWDALLEAGEVTLVDLRNRYEIDAGTFPGAIDPGTTGFREFPAWAEASLPDKDAPVAMFCTGGIRCAKAAAWMRGQGWQDVRELDGGILRYLEDVPAQESRWEGECFVFDDRVSLLPGLSRGQAEVCHGCRRPLRGEDRDHVDFEPGVSCGRCRSSTSEHDLERRRERRRQVEWAQSRGEEHLAPQKNRAGEEQSS